MPITILQQYLLDLDFTLNDAVVYETLLKLEPCAAGPIVTETQFHRNIVYTSLDHLISRKLVACIQVRGKKTFQTTTPQILSTIYENKVEQAKKAIDIISQTKLQPLRDITIHQGNEEYTTLLISLLEQLPKGATKYVLGTGGEDFMRETMRPMWKKYHSVAHAQNLHINMIAYAAQRTAIETDTNKESIYTVKYLQDSTENPAGLHIYPELNTVLSIIYSDEHSPVIAIKITHTALVEGYMKFFSHLWEEAQS